MEEFVEEGRSTRVVFWHDLPQNTGAKKKKKPRTNE